MSELMDFEWKQQPEAESLILKLLEAAVQDPWLRSFKEDLRKICNTGLMEWIDCVSAPLNAQPALEKVGFQVLYREGEEVVYRHPGAQLPDIVLKDAREIAIHVDSIADFLAVRHIHAEIQGSPYSGFRSCLIPESSSCHIRIVERRGTATQIPIHLKAKEIETYLLAKEKWKTRPRNSDDLEAAYSLAKELCTLIGQDQAACLVLTCEREYWQARNLAGQIQKNRQDRLGLGWANHDHHTFRSSRKNFPLLVKIFELLGFHCRERFYAGAQAGWGAQVMENPRAKLVLFLDVDLLSEEINIDFAHEPLKEVPKLGTIGLWCGLHGDSLGKAGMHHLEAQFEFNELKVGLEKFGVKMMDPFSNFSYLKQAFTQGEMWQVDSARIDALLNEGKITPQEANRFRSQGAIGSHMENLQRKEGYKGFNQNNVSSIIKKTDPRK